MIRVVDHLRQLRDGGLVATRRSAAHGRDTHYAVDLARGRPAACTGLAFCNELFRPARG